LIRENAKEEKSGKETVHTYEYDAYGNVAKQDDTDFVYGDVSGQVTKETTKLTKYQDVVKKYTYDSGDNKISLRVKAGEETKLSLKYAYDGQSHLTSVAEEEGSTITKYTYDTNGNQLATVNRYDIPSDKTDKVYLDLDVTLGDNRLNENVVNRYDAKNQLTQTLTRNYEVNYTYDAEGLRSTKTVNGEKTVFVWDGDQLVLELSYAGKVKHRYIRGNDLVYTDKGADTEKQYHVTNPHGDVVQLTDENGKIIKTYEYDSFGNEVSPDKKDDNPFRYCGEYYDRETDEAVSGLLGNIWQESKMNPGQWECWNNKEKGYGIVQWTPAIKFLNWSNYTVEKANRMAKKNPKKYMDMQLKYLLKSMKTSEWIPTRMYYCPYKMTSKKYTHSKKRPKVLAFVFHASYERSGDGKEIIERRARKAEYFYKKLK
jgi:YD repeat-containing protein